MDTMGFHGVKVLAGGVVTPLNQVSRWLLVTAGMPATLKPHGTSSETNRRPDRKSQMPCTRGSQLAQDVTCVALTYAGGTWSTDEEAAKRAEVHEAEKYRHLDGVFVLYQ